MSKLDQIVFLNLGQAGSQIGTAFWELICLEQGIGPDGVPLLTEDIDADNDTTSCLFDIGNSGSYIPRALFIDSEPQVIDEIKTGTYRKLYNLAMMINEKEDASNNYARGSYTIGRKMIRKVKTKIRKISESTDNLRSYFILNSSGGGTGSGLSPLIFLTLTLDYPKLTRFSFSIASGNNYGSAIVEPYNMLLNNFATAEICDFNIFFENQSVYDICYKKLLLNAPVYTDINRLLAMTMSAITAPLRFPATLRSSLDDMLTNLIPYPRIHYPFTRYAPIKHVSKKSYERVSTIELINELFSKDAQFIDVETAQGLFISMVINFQGFVNTADIYKGIEQQKSNDQNRFVEWSPTAFKVGICKQMPTVSPMLQISQCDQAATMLINSTALNGFFMSHKNKFDLLFNKRSFFHWYYGEGMEEIEFTEAKEDIELLIGDFKEIELSESDSVENENEKFKI